MAKTSNLVARVVVVFDFNMGQWGNGNDSANEMLRLILNEVEVMVDEKLTSEAVHIRDIRLKRVVIDGPKRMAVPDIVPGRPSAPPVPVPKEEVAPPVPVPKEEVAPPKAPPKHKADGDPNTLPLREVSMRVKYQGDALETWVAVIDENQGTLKSGVREFTSWAAAKIWLDAQGIGARWLGVLGAMPSDFHPMHRYYFPDRSAN